MPFFNFGKLFLDITTFTTGKLDVLTQTYTPGPGFSTSALYEAIPKDLKPVYVTGREPAIPAPIESIYWFLMNMAFYAILTWYFDNVVPNEFGSRLPLYFPFTKAYWNISDKKDQNFQKNWLKALKRNLREKDEDEEVAKEREEALKDTEFPPVKIVNLQKVYSSWFRSSANDKIAVKQLCLSFKEGKLLALLGQNGAGKSTTMNILSGMTPATDGDALIYGFSIKNEMHNIRKMMGICPQVSLSVLIT